MRRVFAALLCWILTLVVSASVASPRQAEQRFQWPSFRGPGGAGVADGQNPPTSWDPPTGHNVRWKAPIPGLGHSSPTIWNERIFLTTAISDDPDPVFRYGIDGRQDRRSDRSRHVWRVYALDRRSGAVTWMDEPVVGRPTVQRHPKNSYASATPATDGEHVVVLLATGDLLCYDFDGELLWHLAIGPLDAGASYDVTYQWGAASSPIIWQDLVIVQADQQQGSFIAAFDIATGEEVWRTARQVISSFSTPLIHRGANRVELVTNGAGMMNGYDPSTGEELWSLSSRPVDEPPTAGDPWAWATASTPVSGEGLLFLTSVHHRRRPLFAVREGAMGDLSLEQSESSSANVAWWTPRDGPYATTALFYRGLLYIVSANGVLMAFEPDTGERIYRRRIGDLGGAFSASPVAADGRLYLTSEDGDVFVVKAGREYELLATNHMGEVCLATPAVSEGQIFIRTTSHLFALEDGVPAGVAAPGRSAPTPFPARLEASAVLHFDDFEDGDLFAHNGVRWQTFTDGISAARLEPVADGADGTAIAVRLSGTLTLGAAQGPLAQMYVPFDRGEVPSNLASLGGIRFHARGSGSFDVSLRCGTEAFGVEFGVALEASTEWRQIEIAAGELTQIASAGAPVDWTGDACRGLHFSRRAAANTGEFWFEVDEIVFYGAEAWRSRNRP